MDNQQQEQARKNFIQKRQQQAKDMAKDQAKKKIRQVSLRGGKAGVRIVAQAARQLAMQAARVAVQVAAQAASTLAAATSEVWVPIGLIVIVVIIILMLIAAVFTPILGGENKPTCTGISSKPTMPISLVAADCKYGNKALVYKWESSGVGTLSSPQGPTMTYKPSPSDEEIVTITLVVCVVGEPTNCSDQYFAELTITDAMTDVAADCNMSPKKVLYCQCRNQPWSNQKFDNGTVCSTGCSPTSMAMIMSSYCDTHKPSEIARAFDANGWSRKPGSGRKGTMSFSLWTNKTAWFSSMGYKYANVDLSNSRSVDYGPAKNYLDNGWLLMAGACWAAINGGHSFVVDGIRKDSGGNVEVSVRDPYLGCRDTSYWLSEKMHGGCDGYPGWYYLYPVKAK